MNAPSGAPAAGEDEPKADRTLDSWKEIADFLGVSVRTAHRWKDRAGMPVHGAPAGHVFARAAELDRWRRGQPLSSRRGLLLWGTLALGGAVMVGGLLLLWSPYSVGVPASVTFEGQQVLALDGKGHTRWTATVPDLGFSKEWGLEVSTPDRFLVADLDQDGDTEVLINVIPDVLQDRPGRLVCYSQEGRVRWEFVLGRSFGDRYGEYSQDYLGQILRVVQVAGRRYVLSSATHRRWHPTQVALLEPATGRVVEQFWHPGAITHALVIDPDRDGASDLVLAGLNNPGPGHGTPVVMILRLPFSLVPPVADSVMAELSDGGPRSYVVLPRSDVAVAQGAVATVTRLAFEEPGSILVQARYTMDVRTVLTYRFDLGLRLHAFFAEIEVAAAHDTLWRAGVLTHPFSEEEKAWLQGVRSFAYVPDGNAALVPAFRPGR